MHRTLTVLIAMFALACGDDAPPPDDGGPGRDGGPDSGTDADVGPIDVTVTIDDGDVVGRAQDGVTVFWGIPFAAPTGGDARWRPPVPPTPWTTPLDATERGGSCVQSALGDFSGTEDCLRLNVWTPELAPESPLPVMVWIHGGAFVGGSGRSEVYDADALALAGPVVVVTINYRLDDLGYFAHPALTAEAGGSSGNYGLMDQIAALEWVRDNVGRFGGDPSNVTVFGESAGGHSVCQLLVSPAADGLFHRAISQSGICTLPLLSLAEAEAIGEATAARVGCDTAPDVLACLRAVPAETLIDAYDVRAQPGGLFYQDEPIPFPIVDGVLLPEPIEAALAAGRVADVPIVLGTTRDEGSLFHQLETLAVPVADEAEMRAALTRRWGAMLADLIVAQYPVADYDDANQALEVATTDGIFTCPARRVARHLATAGNPTFRYVLTTPTASGIVPGVFHGVDIVFVFGNPTLELGRLTAVERPLSDAIQRYWTTFASSGDPNGAPSVAWPSYTTVDENVQIFDDPIEPMAGYRDTQCDFWDSIYDTL